MGSKARLPFVTTAAAIASVLLFAGLQFSSDPEALERFGYRTGWDVWDGDFWALWTSVFLHGDLMHIAFNLYWLWILGRVVERTIGSGRYLLFFLAAAGVSSAAELAVSDDMGIGLSGVGYALFGFVWLARDRYPRFRPVLDAQLVGTFLIWLVLCVAATRIGLMNIANTAHFAGLAFGALVAGAVLPRWRIAGIAGLVLLTASTTIAMAWAPWSPSWNGLAGERAAERGEDEEAIARFTRAVELEPEYAWAYAERGFARSRLERYEAAIEDFTRALAEDPNHYWALGGRGEARRSLGDPAAAAEDFTRALEFDRDYVFAYNERGWCRQLQGDHAAAVADFTEAIERGGEDAWSLALRGESYMELGRYDEADADLSRAVALDPGSFFAVCQRGWCRARRSEYEASIADFDRALELSPRNSWALTGRGLARRLAGDPEGAVADLGRAVELDGASDFTYSTLGSSLHDLERWEESLEALGRAAELRGGAEADEMFLVAMNEWRLGRKADARQSFIRARELKKPGEERGGPERAAADLLGLAR